MTKNTEELLQRVMATLEWLEQRSIGLGSPYRPPAVVTREQERALEAKECMVQCLMLGGPLFDVLEDLAREGESVLPDRERMQKARRPYLNHFSPMDEEEYAAFMEKWEKNQVRLRGMVGHGYAGDPSPVAKLGGPR